MNIKLNKSGVVYDDSAHKYTYEGRELKGITGTLHKMLFPDMYKNVDEATLKKAAERGTLIHEQVELVASLDIIPSLDSVKMFVNTIDMMGYEIVGCEYVLRIGEDHASAIDLVMHYTDAPDNEVEIWDIKTTYSVNKEYVRWQNSIYKVGFEELNPNLKVRAISCMWLRDDAKRGTICKLVQLGEPHPKEDVERLFECEKEGIPYKEKKSTQNIPYYIADNEAALMDVEERIARLTDYRDGLKAAIMEGLINDNIKSVKTEFCTYSLREGGERNTLDTKAFDADDEELYKELLKKYSKKTKIKPSITIKKVAVK